MGCGEGTGMKSEIFKDKNLALFFSCGISLKTWHDIGMIDREAAIYNELSKYFKRIYFFTYGADDDLNYKSHLADNITVVPRKWIPKIHFVSSLVYSFLLPIIHRRILKKVDILKTNQMSAALGAIPAKLIYRKKLVARTGFVWSIFVATEHPKSLMKLLTRIIERIAYRLADAAITSSVTGFDYIERNYHPKRHIFITNYVETEVFKPMDIPKKHGSICFVGSLSKQKNTRALLEAFIGLPYQLDIIGSGPLSTQLHEMVKNSRINASFLGNIPNHELPEFLNRHEAFILPSLWEGMPKTLLEAMACGLPVIGTNVTGINEVIEDGGNGILCDTTPESIRQAITHLMEDEELKKRLGENARKTIEQEYSLDRLVEKELELYSQLLA
jgi:glycosyltransferase involved in cell wall biosynthesis